MAQTTIRFLVCAQPANRRCIEGILPSGNAPAGFEIVEIPSNDPRLTPAFLANYTGYYFTAGNNFAIHPLSTPDRVLSLRGAAEDVLEIELRQIRPAIDSLIIGLSHSQKTRVGKWLDSRISAVKNIYADDAYSDLFRGAAVKSLVDGPTEISERDSTPFIVRAGEFAKLLSQVNADPTGARLFVDAQGGRVAFANSNQFGAAVGDLGALWDVRNWAVGSA